MSVRAATVVICMLLEVAALGWPEPKTGADGWLTRRLSGELAGPATLGQRFTATGDGLSGIVFHARGSALPVEGDVDLTLTEIRSEGRQVLDRRRVPASTVIASDSYAYVFPRRPDSREHLYELTLALPDTRAGHGIRVDLINGPSAGDPASGLFVGGTPRYGALRFRAAVDRPTMLTRTAAYLSNGPMGSAAIVLALALWIGLHVLALRIIVTLHQIAYA